MRNNYFIHTDSGLYLKKNEKFECYMNPLQYMRCNANKAEGYKLPLYVLLSLFQDKIHTLLYQFINGDGLSRGSVLLFPLLDQINHSYNKLLEDLLFLSENLNEYPIDFNKSVILLNGQKNDVNIDYIAKVIVTLYSDFENNIKVMKPPTEKKIVNRGQVLNHDDFILLDSKFLEPIINLKHFIEKNMKGMLINYYVHGSMATQDYVKGWSDVDTLMIIKQETIRNVEKLLRLRRYAYESTKYFYSIDPLQHHGHIILTEIDLQYYPQPYFPLLLFEYSLPFFDEKEIVIYERDSELERLNTFWNTCYYFRNMYVENKRISNVFELKTFLHILQLLPIAYLQADEQYCYKKYSFDHVKKEFIGNEWNIIEKATKIRSEWQYKGLFDGICMIKVFEQIPNPKSYFILNHLLNKQIPEKVTETLGENYYEDAFLLSEHMLKKKVTEYESK